MLDNFIGPERPLSWVLQFWPVPVLSFISALIATLLCKNIALKFGIVDKPDKMAKIHKGSVAYFGGIGILVYSTSRSLNSTWLWVSFIFSVQKLSPVPVLPAGLCQIFQWQLCGRFAPFVLIAACVNSGKALFL